MSSEYIVYAAFDKQGNCLYVGEGKPDRYKHISSGVSHVYEANRWHFANKYIRVDILHDGLTKQAAVELEQKEISERCPAWNKCEYATTQLMDMYRFASKRVTEFVKHNPRYRGKQDRYKKLAKDLCKLMNRNGETIVLQGQQWSSEELPAGFMSHLARNDDKYYPVLKYVFEVSKVNGTKGYRVTLRGWNNEE